MAFLDVRYRINTSTTPEYTVPNNSGAITLAADDIAIGACTIDSTAPVFDPGDYPTGFTEIAENSVATPDGQKASLAWKRLTGADTGTYTFLGPINGSAVAFLSGCLSFRGRHTTNPPVVTVNSSSASNASTVSIVATGHTLLAGDDDLIIAIPDVTVSGSADVFTAPAGYTSLTASETGFLSIYCAVKENCSAGATGDLTSTLTLTGAGPPVAGWICYHVRIPAAPGGGTPVNIVGAVDAVLIAEQAAVVRLAKQVAASLETLVITERTAQVVQGAQVGFDALVIQERTATLGLATTGLDIAKTFRYPSPILRM